MGPSRLATSAHGSLLKGFGGEGAGVGPSAFAGTVGCWRVVAVAWPITAGPKSMGPSRLATSAHGSLPKGFGGEGAGLRLTAEKHGI